MNPLENLTRDSMRQLRSSTYETYENENANHYAKLLKTAFNDSFHNQFRDSRCVASTLELYPKNLELLKGNGFDVWKISIMYIEEKHELTLVLYYVCWDNVDIETIYKRKLEERKQYNCKILHSDYVKL